MKLHRPRTYARILKRAIFGPLALHPEPKVFEALKRLRGKVFVDVGANIGVYSVPLSKNFEKVFAFEPNPRTWPDLIKNIGSRRNVRVMQYALSSSVGSGLLYVDQVEHRSNQALGSADTILPEFDYRPVSHPEISQRFTGKRGLPVFFNTFDNVFREADLVKIDVEGAEFLVLEGMKLSLKARRVARLVVELHNRDRAKELENMMKGHGYSFKWLDADHLFAWPSSYQA